MPSVHDLGVNTEADQVASGVVSCSLVSSPCIPLGCCEVLVFLAVFCSTLCLQFGVCGGSSAGLE